MNLKPTYSDLILEFALAQRALEDSVAKNWSAVQEIASSTKRFGKAYLQMLKPSNNLQFWKECFRNGYSKTIDSGFDAMSKAWSR